VYGILDFSYAVATVCSQCDYQRYILT